MLKTFCWFGLDYKSFRIEKRYGWFSSRTFSADCAKYFCSFTFYAYSEKTLRGSVYWVEKHPIRRSLSFPLGEFLSMCEIIGKTAVRFYTFENMDHNAGRKTQNPG